jgi:hypothetical protein
MIIVIARKITFFFFHAAARAEEQQQQQDVRTLNDASVFFNPLRAFLTFYVYPSFYLETRLCKRIKEEEGVSPSVVEK